MLDLLVGVRDKQAVELLQQIYAVLTFDGIHIFVIPKYDIEHYH
jgi:hypothetical protein